MATYRKLRAEKLFTGTVMYADDKVLISRDDGKIEAIVNIDEAGDDIEYFPGMVCPGFINAHCHLDLSHLKHKIIPRTGLVDFVQQVMAKRNNNSPEEKLDAMQATADEMYASGIMAVGDICNADDSIPVKLNSPIAWVNFAEISGFVDATADQRFQLGLATVNRFKHLGLLARVVPHSPYSVSKTLFRLINDHSEGQVISIHNQEAAAENELYKNKSGGFLKLYENLGIDITGFAASGKNSLPTWMPYFSKQQSIISVHNSFSSEDDINFAQRFAASNSSAMHYCICINANLYIENTLPPIEMLMEKDANMVIGTDSYASNYILNVWEEIKTIRRHFPGVAIETLLGWATINGARALGLNEQLGSFDKGKNPGMVHIFEDVAKRIV